MEYKIAFDDNAQDYLPGMDLGDSSVELDDSVLAVRLGDEFEARLPVTSVSAVRSMPDPRPEVFLPPGLSAAMEQLGRDTVAVIGSYDGLIAIDFEEPVEARLNPTDSSSQGEPANAATVQFRHLILSLEDPQSFTTDLTKRIDAPGPSSSGARPT